LAGLRLAGAPPPRLTRPLALARLPRAPALPSPVPGRAPLLLPLASVGLAPVQLGSQLVAAALPALGDLLDGVAHRLEPIQLARSAAA
jgi:hypothetical protein